MPARTRPRRSAVATPPAVEEENWRELAPDGWQPGEEASRFVQAPRSRGAASYNAREHTVEIVMATGYRVRRWFGWEELAISEEAVDLRRVSLGQVRFIDHHNSYERGAILGTVVEARVESGQLIGVVKFHDTTQGRAAEQDAASGNVTGASVGYRINKLILSETNDGEDDVYRAERWELLELSSVSVPADPLAGVRSVERPSTPSSSTAGRTAGPTQESTMSETERAAAAEAARVAEATRAAEAAAEATRVAEAARAAEAAEAARVAEAAEAARVAEAARASQSADAASILAGDRARVAELTSIATRAGMPPAVLAEAVNRGTTVESFRAVAFDMLAERSQQGVGTGTLGVEATRGGLDETATRRTGITEALVARMIRGNPQNAARGERPALPEIARPYAEMHLAEMAAAHIGHRGFLRNVAEATNVMQRAMTTSDFPILLMDAMGRRLLARYTAAAPTYRRWAAPYTAVDFRAMNVLRAGDFPALQPIAENGEIKHGAFSESKEQFSVTANGVMMTFTRHMMINDQLGAIDQVLGSAGVRVADWENSEAYSVLLANGGVGPTLKTDSKAVFHTDHGNLAAVSAVVGVTPLGVARAAMMTQTTLDGITANFTPVTVLLSPLHLTGAEQLMTSITPAAVSNVVPESFRRLVPIADGNITTDNWWLFADPAIAPCFVYGYLQGFEGPRLTSGDAPFNMQGFQVKLEHDFGVNAIDYRGAYKNAGAAS